MAPSPWSPADLVALAHEVFLEAQFASRGLDARFHAVIGHGQDVRFDPHRLAPTAVVVDLVGVVAQRLLRLICKYCKQEVAPNPDLVRRLKVPDTQFYAGKGCKNCEGTGYRGRTVISEVMLMSSPIQKAIMDRADASVVRAMAHEEGMETMLEDGVHKAVKGLTTLEEVARVV